MKTLPLLLTLPFLAACGGSDPVTDPEDAASAPAIEATVNQAQNTAIEAQLNATGRPGDPQAREEVARNLMVDTDAPSEQVVPPALPQR